jgi:hypothetical protein
VAVVERIQRGQAWRPALLGFAVVGGMLTLRGASGPIMVNALQAVQFRLGGFLAGWWFPAGDSLAPVPHETAGVTDRRGWSTS